MSECWGNYQYDIIKESLSWKHFAQCSMDKLMVVIEVIKTKLSLYIPTFITYLVNSYIPSGARLAAMFYLLSR